MDFLPAQSGQRKKRGGDPIPAGIDRSVLSREGRKKNKSENGQKTADGK
jgi:hypothetical protein